MRVLIRLTTIGFLAGSLLATVAFARQENTDEEVMRMAKQISRAIMKLPTYGVFDDIRFGIQGSTVVLRGFASRPTLASSAEKVTLKVKGVEEVLNQVEVLPNSNFDDELRANVYVKVYGHPNLQRYNPNRGSPLFDSITRREFGITHDPPPGNHPIKIIVKNGNVTLEGVVANAGDRTIAGIQANATPGVFSVTNDIVVPSESN